MMERNTTGGAYYNSSNKSEAPTRNPVWWFPTDRTDFLEIQTYIDGIIARATLIEKLPRDSAAYQQGMDDLRGKVRALESQLAEASGYMFVSGLNIVTSGVWFAVFAIIGYLLRRRQFLNPVL
jgi:hypothetical protein